MQNQIVKVKKNLRRAGPRRAEWGAREERNAQTREEVGCNPTEKTQCLLEDDVIRTKTENKKRLAHERKESTIS